MSLLRVLGAGPSMTVQDQGRPGFLARGLSKGGALDLEALAEGNALLGQNCAAIEMMGLGGTFQASRDLRIALTGAPMRVNAGGTPLQWNASHFVPEGVKIEIGRCSQGSAGYLHVGGGIDTPERLGSRSAHLTAKFGTRLQDGDELPLGRDERSETGLTLDVDTRFEGGRIRVAPSFQTDMFSQETRHRFETAVFAKDNRATRMGAPILSEGAGYGAQAGLSILSEVITPGDIQVTGDGTPYVLMAEAQTTGGYPRIGTVIAADLPRMAQATASTPLRMEFVALDAARAINLRWLKDLNTLAAKVKPLFRDPADIPDLLSYSLISGVIAGDEFDAD